jgi:hypothetical protein
MTTADISWDEIHKFYAKKKEEWSNTTSYYGDRTTLRGNEKSHSHPSGYYGFEFLPPYSNEEIQLYERKMGFHLPDDLRSYLILVSRELYTSAYPIVFNLFGKYDPDTYEDNDPELCKSFGYCHLPSSVNIWNYQNCLKHVSECRNCGDECFDDIEEDDPCGGMKCISDGGCTDQAFIVLKGNDIGTIWHDGNGGDALYRGEEKTFYEYITKPIKRERGDFGRSNHSMFDIARTYNFMRIISGQGGLLYNN